MQNPASAKFTEVGGVVGGLTDQGGSRDSASTALGHLLFDQ